ncbi:MAG TPA: hypothetical protein VFI24_27385 [Pyrinomonadaceae bacterium]|nr:hypothetical protein [Pyrinomonadaceae bacterium]
MLSRILFCLIFCLSSVVIAKADTVTVNFSYSGPLPRTITYTLPANQFVVGAVISGSYFASVDGAPPIALPFSISVESIVVASGSLTGSAPASGSFSMTLPFTDFLDNFNDGAFIVQGGSTLVNVSVNGSVVLTTSPNQPTFPTPEIPTLGLLATGLAALPFYRHWGRALFRSFRKTHG